MNLNVFMPTKLITGAGCVRANAKALAALGKTCLIVTGKTSAKACGALQDVTDTLDANGQNWQVFDEIGEFSGKFMRLLEGHDVILHFFFQPCFFF